MSAPAQPRGSARPELRPGETTQAQQTESPAQPRPKRKDARLNSDRLVRAAREVFAKQGLTATLEDVAQHAGVGVGTVYRNFASKREIVKTLYDEIMASVLADIRPALTMEDPWLAIVTFFEVAAAHQAEDRGLCELLLGQDGFGLTENTAAELIAMLTPLFDRAQAAGVLREGVTTTDIGPIFVMLDSVYGLSETSPELWRRYLTLLLDGLRAGDRPALPVPALDPASFAAALSAAG